MTIDAPETMQECQDARVLRRGSYSAWLKKMKSDNAKMKWLSSSSKRYFTIDFDNQRFYYQHSQGQKHISSPISFRDILGAERLAPAARASKKKGKEQDSGFILRTHEKTFELYAASNADAAQWVYALNAARELGTKSGSNDEVAGNATLASSSSAPSMMNSTSSTAASTGQLVGTNSSYADELVGSTSERTRLLGNIPKPTPDMVSSPSSSGSQQPRAREPASSQDGVTPPVAMGNVTSLQDASEPQPGSARQPECLIEPPAPISSVRAKEASDLSGSAPHRAPAAAPLDALEGAPPTRPADAALQQAPVVTVPPPSTQAAPAEGKPTGPVAAATPSQVPSANVGTDLSGPPPPARTQAFAGTGAKLAGPASAPAPSAGAGPNLSGPPPPAHTQASAGAGPNLSGAPPPAPTPNSAGFGPNLSTVPPPVATPASAGSGPNLSGALPPAPTPASASSGPNLSSLPPPAAVQSSAGSGPNLSGAPPPAPSAGSGPNLSSVPPPAAASAGSAPDLSGPPPPAAAQSSAGSGPNLSGVPPPAPTQASAGSSSGPNLSSVAPPAPASSGSGPDLSGVPPPARPPASSGSGPDLSSLPPARPQAAPLPPVGARIVTPAGGPLPGRVVTPVGGPLATPAGGPLPGRVATPVGGPLAARVMKPVGGPLPAKAKGASNGGASASASPGVGPDLSGMPPPPVSQAASAGTGPDLSGKPPPPAAQPASAGVGPDLSGKPPPAASQPASAGIGPDLSGKPPPPVSQAPSNGPKTNSAVSVSKDAKLDAIWKWADQDGDGILSREEFTRLIQATEGSTLDAEEYAGMCKVVSADPAVGFSLEQLRSIYEQGASDIDEDHDKIFSGHAQAPKPNAPVAEEAPPSKSQAAVPPAEESPSEGPSAAAARGAESEMMRPKGGKLAPLVLEFDMGGAKKPVPKGLAERLSKKRSSKKKAAQEPELAALPKNGTKSIPEEAEPSGWDSDDNGPKKVPAKPSACAQSAETTFVGDTSTNLESSGWDSDDDGAKAPAQPDAPAASSGWDDEDDFEESPPENKEDAACGAPKQVAANFVAAKPRPTAPQGGDAKANGEQPSELNDLLSDMLTAGSAPAFKGSGSHTFVPDFHCTGCDMQVLRIENHVWSDGVSYMFLRNNYPNIMKLRAKLVPKKECCACCCQCSSRSADSAAELDDIAEGLKWKVVKA